MMMEGSRHLRRDARQIVRETTLAALNIDYPSEKLTVIICDDGNSASECPPAPAPASA
jgi:cellulose synthase/poly-beta-1,6-N-acetylglucosamine synthase-like glycosyltransferase